jgi:DNA mismatch endonuclease (patch repair protein)
MSKIRQKGTDAEMALRRAMYRLGLHYRVDYEVLRKPRRIADLAFPGRKIAVFVDGCFWHGCPDHATWPKQNADFWRKKIEANRQRDADTNDRLRSLGWKVRRFWSHESSVDAAKDVARMVAEIDSTRRTLSSPSGSQREN